MCARLSKAIVKMELNNIPLFRSNWFLMGAFGIFFQRFLRSARIAPHSHAYSVSLSVSLPPPDFPPSEYQIRISVRAPRQKKKITK